MEIGPEWASWGLPGLFLAAFLAATILPFSSEALLAAMVLGPWSSTSLWLVASVGNTLGGMTNYAIGRWIPGRMLPRWSRIDPGKVDRWQGWIRRYGPWSALLCWLPVVGDPIALALGLLRVRFAPVLLLMFAGKALRYAVILGLVLGSMDRL